MGGAEGYYNWFVCLCREYWSSYHIELYRNQIKEKQDFSKPFGYKVITDTLWTDWLF